jgi:hypothetical protein
MEHPPNEERINRNGRSPAVDVNDEDFEGYLNGFDPVERFEPEPVTNTASVACSMVRAGPDD